MFHLVGNIQQRYSTTLTIVIVLQDSQEIHTCYHCYWFSSTHSLSLSKLRQYHSLSLSLSLIVTEKHVLVIDTRPQTNTATVIPPNAVLQQGNGPYRYFLPFANCCTFFDTWDADVAWVPETPVLQTDAKRLTV